MESVHEEHCQQEAAWKTLVSGNRMSSMLASSSSSGGHDALSIAALKSAEDLAPLVRRGHEAADVAVKEVRQLERIFDLVETEQEEAAATQVELTNTIVELRQQVFSLTDSHHALLRRVEHMERNVRPRLDEPLLQENRHGGRVLPASFGLRGGMQIFVKALTARR